MLDLTASENKVSRDLVRKNRLYNQAVSNHSPGRYLFRTETGEIGLAPIASEAGDQIYVLLGCDSLLVLRPTTAEHYKVIGECYMHGLTHGTAFLGQLPEGWLYVYSFSDRHPGFVNDKDRR